MVPRPATIVKGWRSAASQWVGSEHFVVLYVLWDGAGTRLEEGRRIISEGMIGKKYSRGPVEVLEICGGR